jgi:hypothetical protein
MRARGNEPLKRFEILNLKIKTWFLLIDGHLSEVRMNQVFEFKKKEKQKPSPQIFADKR